MGNEVPEAISAQHTIVYIQIGGAGDFLEIGELQDVKPWAWSRKAIETTPHNRLQESFVVGILRKSEMTLTLGYLPGGSAGTNHDKLEDSILAGRLDIFKVVFPNNVPWVASGYVINLGPTTPVDDKLTADVTIRPTGTAQMG
jgi:hypothetical protein